MSMDKTGVSLKIEGSPTCGSASYVEGGEYCAVRQSATNCWNANTSNRNLNNNNTNNRNYVFCASESVFDIDEWMAAEYSFFKNKHGSIGAQRIHIHPARIIRLSRRVASGTYYPRPGYCFPILEPSPRQIFAAFCEDRVVHHYVAPFISEVCEGVHKANGDVSHGNRIGHSAQTGAEQIREAMEAAKVAYQDPYVVKLDLQCFFNSIPRRRAYNALEHYANIHYKGTDKEEKLAICKILILHDPTKGCARLAADQMKLVPARKMMENARPGCALPIGNFYSQLVANLYLAALDAKLKDYGICPRFVDDKCCIVRDRETAGRVLSVAKAVTEELGLILHPKKVYIQPVHRGVNFCGRTVKGRRIYLSNRTLRRAFDAIKAGEDALKVCSSVNSYLGLMRHCTEWKNEKRLADLTLSLWSKWVYFKIDGGHFVCKVKQKYSPRRIRESWITNLINNDYVLRKTDQRSRRPHRV